MDLFFIINITNNHESKLVTFHGFNAQELYWSKALTSDCSRTNSAARLAHAVCCVDPQQVPTLHCWWRRSNLFKACDLSNGNDQRW